AGLAVLAGGSFVGTFVAAFGAGLPPPGPFMIALWCVILGGAAFAYWKQSGRIKAGKDDLVIDRTARTITLPQSFGRREPVVIPLADVLSVEAVRIETKDEDGCQVRYAPTVRWRDGEEDKDGKVIEWADRRQAERLAAWITERCTPSPTRERGPGPDPRWRVGLPGEQKGLIE
ncbi:MAG: hypothetical protein J2P46_21290, partial [Zavarzinella sp.]|nr:hypothetical protein [Zavarzinella sp.]